MILSRKWMNEEFVDLSHIDDHEFAETMNAVSQKVKSYKRMDKEIKNVVVGRVISIDNEKDSDHVWACQIDIGQQEPVRIVTAARNIKPGDLVPTALQNAYLTGGIHITDGKLCSFSELGLTSSDVPEASKDGIWILNRENCRPGDDINLVIGNDDTIFDFQITSERPDCYSIIGLAREAAAAFNKPMKHHEPVVKSNDVGSIYELLDVDVFADELCNRYTSRMVKNVKIAPSPKWLRQRLRANGIRPINNIVDIANYVTLECGQPLNVFDYSYVSAGYIMIRQAQDGEALTTQDGQMRRLKNGMLVIADDSHPIGLAGIMCGENAEIKDDTMTVVFEAANFKGNSIHKTALALGMTTNASIRYKKELDPMMTLPAVQRACELVEQLNCGEVLDGIIDIINYVPVPRTLELEPEKINGLLGTDISEADMIAYLKRLEIPVKDRTVLIPSFRPDINGITDIAKEVDRLNRNSQIRTT